jgi:hypothetical protein
MVSPLLFPRSYPSAIEFGADLTGADAGHPALIHGRGCLRGRHRNKGVNRDKGDIPNYDRDKGDIPNYAIF